MMSQSQDFRVVISQHRKPTSVAQVDGVYQVVGAYKGIGTFVNNISMTRSADMFSEFA